MKRLIIGGRVKINVLVIVSIVTFKKHPIFYELKPYQNKMKIIEYERVNKERHCKN